jgi:hypothetical protein
MPPTLLYRGIVLLLWALAAYNSWMSRGLFWDGAAFLVNIIDFRDFHDFYPARAHIGWVTQLPVLLALKLGVTDTRLLAIVQSAALFALPVALYQLALARVRHDSVLLAMLLAVIAIVYLPTSFFIVGEYNAAYAAATATVAIVLTSGPAPRRDGVLLALLAALCLRSYEAMVYFGPLLAAVTGWWTSRVPAGDPVARLLGALASLAFLAGAVVSGVTIVVYWDHPHFTLVRAAVLDFWQNLQFVIPVVALAIFGAISLLRPTWLRGAGPTVVIGAAALALIVVVGAREFRPDAILFPPAHYVARTAAGCVLWVMIIVMWAYVAWRERPPALLVVLREAGVGRRLALATAALVVAAAIPDLALTRLWSDYLGYLRGVVAGRSGTIWAHELPLWTWPNSLFVQEWTLPALSSVLRAAPGQAVVLVRQDFASNLPFTLECGTLPRLQGYAWKE